MDNALEVRDFCVNYGRKRIITDIACSINGGELCALIGQNGSGKTTLIRGIAGLVPHTGRCILNGEELSSLGCRRRARMIGYCSSEPFVPKEMSCCELVLTGYSPDLGLIDKFTQAQKNAAREVLDKLGIAALSDEPMGKLSSGQRQLALVARALVRKPGLLLLDEPDAALDYGVRRNMMDVLRRQANETGCIVLMASHDVNLVLPRADKFLFMQNGQMLDCGAHEALKRIYGNVELIKHGNSDIMVEK